MRGGGLKGKRLRAGGFAAVELVLLVVVLAVVGVTGWVAWTHHSEGKPTPGPTATAEPANGSVVMFSGKITADTCANNRFPVGDVGCSMTIGGNEVSVVHGNVGSTMPDPWGSLLAADGKSAVLVTDYVGRTASVKAAKVGSHSYTLEGSADYYVRLGN
jgi:hypothetical protein